MQAGRQAEEEVSRSNAEGNRLRKAIQKHTRERYAQKQVCSTITTALNNTNLFCLCAQRARVCQNSSATAALCFRLLAVVSTLSSMKTAKSLCKPTTVSIYTASEDHYSLAAQHSGYCHRYEMQLDIKLCSHASFVAVAQRRHLSTICC